MRGWGIRLFAGILIVDFDIFAFDFEVDFDFELLILIFDFERLVLKLIWILGSFWV